MALGGDLQLPHSFIPLGLQRSFLGSPSVHQLLHIAGVSCLQVGYLINQSFLRGLELGLNQLQPVALLDGGIELSGFFTELILQLGNPFLGGLQLGQSGRNICKSEQSINIKRSA